MKPSSSVKKLNKLFFQIDFVTFSHQTQAQRSFQDKQNERQKILINRNFIEYSKQMSGMLINKISVMNTQTKF